MNSQWIVAATLSVLVSAAPVALAEEGDQAAMVAAGHMVYHKCEACHALESSQNGFGPSLHGVLGRKAGTVPRFAYSDALKNSDITWTEANLRRWIVDNQALVPGTRMRHVSVTDPAEQDYLIAFLKSLD